MQHELDRLREHYDAMVDIAEIKYGGDCQIEIHDLMDLLCNGFQYCPSNGNCMDKTEYQEFITNYCNSYEDVDYSIQINPSNQHDLTYISLEIQWTFLTTDGCTRKVNEHHKIYYNDEGLITKFYDEPISDDTECSQSGYDSNTDPTIEYPQETVYQDEYRREYSSVQIAEDDPARLLFNEVTNPTELGYIEADLDKLQDQIAEIDAIMASKDFVGMSLSEAWSKDISENTIRYICLIALEEVTPEDGVVVLNVYIQYDVTKLAHAKNNILSGLIDHFGDILCKSKTGKAEDGINLYCTDIEYDGVCDKDTDDEACAMFPSKIKGRDGVLKYFKQYEDIFDEAKSRYDFINDRLITSYRKGLCQGEYSQKVEFEYDEARQCISKWTEHLGETMTSDKGCHNSAAAFNRKILEECKFDDEIDNEYIPDQPSTTFGYKSDSGFDALVKNYEDCEPITTSAYSGSPMLRKKGREMKLKAFYKAAFDCELKENQGNTQLLDTFMNYLSNSVKLCIIEDNACYDKDEIREGMVARYLDDNELIDYQVEITSNDACKIESKCVSQRRTPKGCMVIKEEYDTCLFDNDGSIKEFTVNRSNRRVECDYNDNE